VLARLQEATSAALSDPTVMNRIAAMGVDATPTLGEAAQARVTGELARWVPMIRAAGITAE
jgi:tripartite-type tricarboxylate transporter receptor subunit TctC